MAEKYDYFNWLEDEWFENECSKDDEEFESSLPALKFVVCPWTICSVLLVVHQLHLHLLQCQTEDELKQKKSLKMKKRISGLPYPDCCCRGDNIWVISTTFS